MALIIAIPFSSTIQKEAGSSMAFSALLKDFDYTVYRDFMNHSAMAIQPYISTAIWMGIFYLLFTIFFEGGILKVLKEKRINSLSGFSGRPVQNILVDFSGSLYI